MEDDLIGLLVFAIIGWFIVALIVGKAGGGRKFGFAGAFYASLFLTPILAMLFVLASDKKPYTGLTKGDKQALLIPISVIGGITILISVINEIGSQKREEEQAKLFVIEQAERLEQKRIQDSILMVSYHITDDVMKAELAKQSAIRAKHDALTADEQTKANIATAKYNEEVEKVSKIPKQ